MLSTIFRFNFSMILIKENMTVLNRSEAMQILSSNVVKSTLQQVGFNIDSIFVEVETQPPSTSSATVPSTYSPDTVVKYTVKSLLIDAAKQDESKE